MLVIHMKGDNGRTKAGKGPLRTIMKDADARGQIIRFVFVRKMSFLHRNYISYVQKSCATND